MEVSRLHQGVAGIECRFLLRISQHVAISCWADRYLLSNISSFRVAYFIIIVQLRTISELC